MDIVVHNFMFLSTFFRKLYEHLNMFIQIGHISWYLLNMFFGIFVTILLFFISTNQNHFKIKKTKLYYFQSQPKSTKPSEKYYTQQVLFLFNQTFNFYYFQTLTNTIKPQLQISNLKPFPNPNKTQIFKPKSDLKSTLSNIKPTPTPKPSNINQAMAS
jgi:hypothetical protein